MFTNGPITTCFDVYQDFMNYTSGIYVRHSNDLLGGHCVKVIGWGYDATSKLNYWMAQNSWGPTWGMQGYFNIAAGQCGFDSNFIAGGFNSKEETLEFNI